VTDIPRVTRVAIYAADGGFYLLHFSARNQMVADTWHVTREEAMEQAKLEYLIGDDDWRTEEIERERTP